MNTNYDKIYQTAHYFKEPYPAFLTFFASYPHKGVVLDLGCGQGRDALALGRMGYTVIGIDASQVGVAQVNQAAESENLKVKAFVDDVFACPVSQKIDIILLDSMLHFYKKDSEKEKQWVLRLLHELKHGGIFCNCMLKSAKNERILQDIITESNLNVVVLAETREFDTSIN